MKKALILAGINWNDTLQRHHQFAYYLVKCGYQVDFVEHIISTKFSWKKFFYVVNKKGKNAEKHINPIKANIRVLTPGFVNPGGFLFKFYNHFKSRILLRSLNGNYDIIINYLPINTTRYIINQLDYSKLVYDCVRNFEGWGGYYDNIVDEEKWLMDKCDYIFTDSYFLTDKFVNISHKNVYQFLPIANEKWLNGCRDKRVDEIKNIAYFGTVDSHIDVNLLKVLTQRGYYIHIWGVVNIVLDFDFLYHGYLTDQTALACDIITLSDAILIPYIGNMDGVIPAKIIQCLATKLPVYVSEFYDTKKMTPYLYTYKNVDDICAKLLGFDVNAHIDKTKEIERFIETLNDKTQFYVFQNIVDN